MKKIYTLLVGVLCLMSITLEARTMQEASAVASAFIQARYESTPAKRLQKAAAATAATAPVELAFTQYQIDNTTPAVFVFNSTDEGFVLVSAEDDARAVLGYSDEGTFDANNIPENMQFWLKMYADELAKAKGERLEVKGKVNRREVKGERREAVAESYPTIAPILGNTVWGQGEPFNNKCPQINGERAVTGCVATAMSQIMYAHKYPTKGTGSHSYTTETKKLNVSANFGNTTYDWDNMTPDYNKSYTTAQANAVATLMFHAGVAADMDYTVDGSGAVSSIALAAMTEYFGYNKSINILPKDFMKEEDILQEVASDLQAGRPVYVSGHTVNLEGHAFVCDGMQSDGYLHINWGWYGSADGYFALSALAPEVQGTGGSASNLAFTEGVCIYSNIKPSTGGEAMPLVTIDKLTRTSSDAISKKTAVGFSLENFTSTGIATASGTLTYFIYNNAGEVVSTVGIGTFELAPGYHYTSAITFSQYLPSSLAQGDYELEIRYIDNNSKDHPILVKGLGEVRVPFTVTSSQFVFGAIAEPEKEMRPFTIADFALVEGTKTWSVDLYSSQFWSETPSETDVLIRCNLHSGSNTAVAGTYTLEAGTIDADVMYAEGYYDACYQYTPTALHLTILPAGGEKMTIQYYMEVNGEVKQGSFTTTPDWYTTTDGTSYQYNTNYNFDLATALPASKALQITKALGHTNTTEMSYFVEGIISTMRNTPEQIVQYNSARFDISDDGTTNNQFYCYNTKWLDNTDFVTGNEIKLGDEVVVLGYLQNYNGNTPEIKGYVYQHTAGEQPEVDYSIKNLQVTTNQDTVFFNFESEAPYFHIKVTKEDGTTAANGLIDFKNAYLKDLTDGNYTLWIRPVDEAQEYYVADAVETTFTITTTPEVDYSIKNLVVTTNQDTVFFNFESEAPYFHIKVTKEDGTKVAEGIIDFKNVYIVLDDGNYTLWIRPVDEAQEYYIGDAVEATFTIETITTDIEDVTSGEMIYLYDMLGRLVDSKMSIDNRPLDVPQSGVYIMNGKKVVIRR